MLSSSRSLEPDGPDGVGFADEKGEEAEREDGVLERGAEVSPELDICAGIVGGEEEEQHHNQAAEACPTNEDAGDQADGYEQFGDCDEGSEENCMRENYAFEERLHEWVAALFDEVADVVGHATPDEFRAGEFVLGEDEKQKADRDAQEGQGFRVLVGCAHFFFC